LGLFEKLVDPKVEHMVEEQASEAIRADQDESGADGSPNRNGPA
jgi:hypothetical protein